MVPLYQNGQHIGWLPTPEGRPTDVAHALIDPSQHMRGPPVAISADPEITSFRRADFRVEWTLENDGWTRKAVLVADPSLGIGDIWNIVGFRPADGFPKPR
jgi:hypothetical protein